MNATIAKEWQDALVSGEFKQGRNRLRSSEGYCCLGVLCELYRRKHTDTARWQDNTTFIIRCGGMWNDRTRLDLPAPVRDWAEMMSDAGQISSMNECLAQLNDEGYRGDSTPLDFAQIAAVIAEHVDEL